MAKARRRTQTDRERLLDDIDGRITSWVLRMALFSAAASLSAPTRASPGGGHHPQRDRGSVRLGAGAAHGHAIVAGQVGADLDVAVAGGRRAVRPTPVPGRRRSRARAIRRAAATPGRLGDDACGWRRGRRLRRTARAVRFPLAGTASRPSVDPRRCRAGWPRRRRARTSSGSASNHEPWRGGRWPRPPDAGEVGAGDVERVRRSVRHPHVTPSIGSSSASARPIAPEPVPRSATMTGRRHRAGQLDGDAGHHLGLRPWDQDRRSTSRSRWRKPHRPSTYCERLAGSYRASIASRWATMRSVPARRARSSMLAGAARHLAQPAGAPASAHATAAPSRATAHQLIVPVTHGSPASCRARSSAASASTTSSRSPASTSARRYTVKPIR